MRSPLKNIETKVDISSVKAPINPTQSSSLLNSILECLSEAKAEKIVSIPISDKSSIADYMVIASGRSDRHVGAIAEQVQKKLKESGYNGIRLEGLEVCDWVLIDCGNVIVHVFRPEVRDFYNLEKMWTLDWSSLDSTN